jgi:hypothetical protein
MAIENTTDFYGRNPELVLLAALADGGTDGLIEGMEARGQRQLVNSDQLPTQIEHGTRAEFEAVGFVFGEPNKSDPLFTPTMLPEGWKREGTDHSMHSNVVDPLGRTRVSVFYKAAFYDRRAGMSLMTPSGYLNGFLWADDVDALPILDDVWLTSQIADETLAQIRDGHLTDAAQWDERIADTNRTEANRAACREHQKGDRQLAAKAEAFRVRIAGGRK